MMFSTMCFSSNFDFLYFGAKTTVRLVHEDKKWGIPYFHVKTQFDMAEILHMHSF